MYDSRVSRQAEVPSDYRTSKRNRLCSAVEDATNNHFRFVDLTQPPETDYQRQRAAIKRAQYSLNAFLTWLER
jgi:hypothetical protein